MARLSVVDGLDLGNEYEVTPPAGTAADAWSIRIGRDAGVEVCLNDQAVSREHCRIERGRHGYRIVDLGSRNRTFVNGEAVKESALRNGDMVRVGDTDLRFETDEAPVEAGGAATTLLRRALSRSGIATGGADGRDSPGRSRSLQGSGATPPAFDDGAPREARHGSARSAVIGEERSGVDRAPAEERARELLYVPGGVAEAASIAILLERFLDSLAPALSASHAAVLTHERRGWVVKARQGGGANGAPLALSLSAVERAAAAKEALLSIATREDERFQDRGSIIQERISSVIAVPLLNDGDVLGVVYADRRRDDAMFADADLELVEAAARELAGHWLRLEEKDRLVEENRNLLRSLTRSRRIIGRSRAIQDVMDFIQRAAPAQMTVLIQGETGTGKELVASAIHYNSPRRSRAFVTINCAALPESLIESELFGHERGAFTGAIARKKGRFELADGGTIFLDEIGELSLACQAKLLRLLEERCFERVGGTEPIQVDVRILAATNKDLAEAVEKGAFREDLIYRLDVLGVRLPPLRERPEDIADLARHFLENVAAGGRPKVLGAAALKKLEKYDWPGNVRQLRNVIESATVLGRSDEIQVEDLVLPERPRSSSGTWEPISLQELERLHVLRVLEFTRGNKKRAAEILGIERCTLYSKLKSYDL